jgi:hypothetical protein
MQYLAGMVDIIYALTAWKISSIFKELIFRLIQGRYNFRLEKIYQSDYISPEILTPINGAKSK